jgi:alkanesulfonate monooxygenase SsuD/methylene tetrahydromethanopterin reductase-like flavin-dependent oxidoreductase (luciferase family)
LSPVNAAAPPSHELLQFGFLNRVYAPAFDTSVFESALRLISAAEALALDSAWVAQHHIASESGRLPSPLALLAAASQRTRKIQLGTGVVVLPFESAVRLAEDASVVDALSAGRLQLGLGAGFDRPTYAAFGQKFDERHAPYDDNLRRLQDLLAGAPLIDTAPEAVLQPPAPALRERLWEAGGRADAIVARRNGFLIAPRGPAVESEQSLIRRYHAQWRAAGYADAPPRIALVRAVFPGQDRKQIEAEIGPDIKTHLQRRKGEFDVADLPAALRRLGVLWGSPQQIVDEIGELSVLRGVSHFIAQVQTRTTSHEAAESRLQLFAEKIVPQVKSDNRSAPRKSAAGWSRPEPTAER